MKLHRIEATIMRHAYESRRNLDRILDMVYWPVLDIIVWGFFTIYLGRGNHLQPGAISFMLGAIILWGLFFAFQRDMAVGFLDELWSRNLVNLFSTPLSVEEYMTGLIAVNVAKAMVGMSCAALIAWARTSGGSSRLIRRTTTPAARAQQSAGTSACATWPRACTPASVRPATVSRGPAGKASTRPSASSTVCWTVRRPGCRAQPWNADPS